MAAFARTSVAALLLALASTAAAQAPHQIAISSFSFAPAVIHLAAGQPVTLTLVNRSGSGHDFTARAFFAHSRILAGAAPGGAIDLAGGQSASITLVPAAGRYPVHCSHFMHKQIGMHAEILVD